MKSLYESWGLPNLNFVTNLTFLGIVGRGHPAVALNVNLACWGIGRQAGCLSPQCIEAMTAFIISIELVCRSRNACYLQLLLRNKFINSSIMALCKPIITWRPHLRFAASSWVSNQALNWREPRAVCRYCVGTLPPSPSHPPHSHVATNVS